VPGLAWTRPAGHRAATSRTPGKNGVARQEPPPFWPSAARSDGADLVSLRALCAVADGELDPLVVLKAAVAACLDGGVVNEDIGSTVIGGDETITLVSVEPLHCALSHCCGDLRGRVRGPRAATTACLREPGSGIRGAAARTSQALRHGHELPVQLEPVNTIARAQRSRIPPGTAAGPGPSAAPSLPAAAAEASGCGHSAAADGRCRAGQETPRQDVHLTVDGGREQQPLAFGRRGLEQSPHHRHEPRSAIWSASSSTTASTSPRWQWPCPIRSASRPGRQAARPPGWDAAR
jgi:hypothetical protein